MLGKTFRLFGKSKSTGHGSDRGGEAKSWFNLGFTYYKLKRISEAKEAFLQSRELFQALELAAKVQKCDQAIRRLET